MREPDFVQVINGVCKRYDGIVGCPTPDELLDKCKPQYAYYYQDNFTIAVLDIEDGRTFVGVSKRNHEDMPNPMKGRSLALARAVHLTVQYTIEQNQQTQLKETASKAVKTNGTTESCKCCSILGCECPVSKHQDNDRLLSHKCGNHVPTF